MDKAPLNASPANALPPTGVRLGKALKNSLFYRTPRGPLLFVACFAFLSFSAQAQESRQEQLFASLRERAKPIENLSSFMRVYMGDCQPGPEAAQCRQQSVAFRQQANQSSHVFFMFEEGISLEVRSLPNGQLNIGWLPFFSAFGYGLSAHAPRQWSREGEPIYAYRYFRGQLPPGTQAEEVLRWQKVGRLAAEIIVTPTGVWKAPPSKGRNQAALEGMSVTWRAIRVFDSRTGETLGVWTPNN